MNARRSSGGNSGNKGSSSNNRGGGGSRGGNSGNRGGSGNRSGKSGGGSGNGGKNRGNSSGGNRRGGSSRGGSRGPSGSRGDAPQSSRAGSSRGGSSGGGSTAGGSQGGAKRSRGGSRRGGQRGTTPIRPPSASRTRPLGGDQVEGRQAVRELLLAGNRRAREIVIAVEMDAAPIIEEILQLADEDRIPIREVGRSKFDAIARTESSQGVLAMAPPLMEYDLDTLCRPNGSTPPFLLVLDGVTDPGNLGSLLRIAECAGVTGVVLPRHRAAHITPTVTKTAAGAIEHLRIGQVTGTPTAISELRDREIWTVGLDMVSDTSVFDLRVATDPVALVLGAEGAGLSKLTRERCDVIAHIPMAGTIGSLNVAAAGSIACFEVVRRRAQS